MDERRKKAHKTIIYLIEENYYTGKELAKIFGISERKFNYRKNDGQWQGRIIDIVFDKFIDIK